MRVVISGSGKFLLAGEVCRIASHYEHKSMTMSNHTLDMFSENSEEQ